MSIPIKIELFDLYDPPIPLLDLYAKKRKQDTEEISSLPHSWKHYIQ